MRKYIEDLTNNLIGRNRYDTLMGHMDDDRDKFLEYVQIALRCGDVSDMKPETLGKIMCSFEIGDVPASHYELFSTIRFDSGDCDDLLRTLVSICLAYTIRNRLESLR